RNAAELVADLGLGELHVRFGDGLAVDLGNDLILHLGLGRLSDMDRSGQRCGEQRSSDGGFHQLVHEMRSSRGTNGPWAYVRQVRGGKALVVSQRAAKPSFSGMARL